MKNKRMKIARMEVDMKQEDLAKAVGVTRQTI
jgi:putative transcriptional regulator